MGDMEGIEGLGVFTDSRPRSAPYDGHRGRIIPLKERTLFQRRSSESLSLNNNIGELVQSGSAGSTRNNNCTAPQQKGRKRPATASRLYNNKTPTKVSSMAEEAPQLSAPIHSIFQALPERDRVALKLGRMIMTAMMDKKEGVRPTSRFFLDRWLSDSRSTAGQADPMSLELLARLQHAKTLSDVDNPAAQKEVEEGDGALPTQPSRLTMAVACEALDALCRSHGASQPVLMEIRSALYPTIFLEDPEPSDMEAPEGASPPLTGKSDYADRRLWFDNDLVGQIEQLKQQLRESEEKVAALEQEARDRQEELRKRDEDLQQAALKANDLRAQLEKNGTAIAALRAELARFLAGKDEAENKLITETAAMEEARKADQVSFNKMKLARDQARIQLIAVQELNLRHTLVISNLEAERDRLLKEAERSKVHYTELCDKLDKDREAAEVRAAKSDHEKEWEAKRCQDVLLEMEKAREAFTRFLAAVKNAMGLEEGSCRDPSDAKGTEEEQVLTALRGLLATLRELEISEKAIKSALSSKEASYGAALNELQLHMDQLQDMQRKHAESEADRQALSKQLAEAQAQVAKLEEDLTQVDEWRRKEEATQEMVRRLQQELSQARAEAAAAIKLLEEGRIRSMELELALLRSQLEAKNQEIGSLHSDLQGERRRRSSLLHKYEEAEAADKSLQAMLNAALQDKVNIEAELQEKDSLLRIWEEREQHQRRHIDMVEEEMLKKNSQINDLRATMTALEEALKASETGHEEERSQWEEMLRKAKEEWEEEASQMRRELTEEVQRVEALAMDNEALREQIRKMEEEAEGRAAKTEDDDDEAWRRVLYNDDGSLNLHADVSDLSVRGQVKALSFIRDHLLHRLAPARKATWVDATSKSLLEEGGSTGSTMEAGGLTYVNTGTSQLTDDDGRNDTTKPEGLMASQTDGESVVDKSGVAALLLEEEYRWGEWGAELFNNPAYRRAFIRAIQDILDVIKELCLPQFDTTLGDDGDKPGGGAPQTIEDMLSSGNDLELRKMLNPHCFSLHASAKAHTGHHHNHHNHSGVGKQRPQSAGPRLRQHQPPPPSPAPPSSSFKSATSVADLSSIIASVVAPEPLSLEAKIRQLRDMVPYIRQRILFGLHWVHYTDEIEDMAREDHTAAEGVLPLARNLNLRFLKHQGTAHRIDEYLRTLLKRERTRVSERAEKFHLEQILFKNQASTAVLGWADKRVAVLNNVGLKAIRPISREQLAHKTEYHQNNHMCTSPRQSSSKIRKLLFAR